MKTLIRCEGPNELAAIRILIKNNLFKYKEEDLIGLTPFHARQLDSPQVKIELNMYLGDFEIILIGDTHKDAFKIPSEYRERIVSIKKYYTKPELEMLFIISENLTKEFDKVKSKVSPKEFAKSHIEYNRRKYKNDTSFYNHYYGDRPDFLCEAIREYKRIKKHKKDELYLADLLK